MAPKRVWKKMAKEERKSNKCWADGARDSILRPHIDNYSDALARGVRAERAYFTKVCVEYHARISWCLLDHEEPALPLARYDANAVVEPEDDLTDEEEDERHERVTELNKRIHTWLKYRARKLNNSLLANATDSHGPFVPLVAKLGGLKSPAKARQACQEFQHQQIVMLRGLCEDAWKAKCKADGVDPEEKKPNAPFRSEVARKAFKVLPLAEQKRYGEIAKKNAAERKAAYVKALKDGPSKSPEDRQKCIDNLPAFLGAIMRGVADYTGWQVLVVVGGPMPKWGGELGTVHLSAGKNLDPVPVSFPAWKKDLFDANVTGFMKKYLATAYSAEQCEEMALPVTEQHAVPSTTCLSAAEYKIPAEGEGDDDDEGDWQDDDEEDDEEGGTQEEEEERTEKTGGKKRKSSGSTDENLPKKKKPKTKTTAASSVLAPAAAVANGASGDDNQFDFSKLTDAELKAWQPPASLNAQQKHEWAKLRNAELLARLDLKHAGSELTGGLRLPKPAAKPKPKPKPLTKSGLTLINAPVRRSGRHTAADEPSGMQDEDVVMLDADDETPAPPRLDPPPPPNETPVPPRVDTPPPPPNETPTPPRVHTPPPPNETPASPHVHTPPPPPNKTPTPPRIHTPPPPPPLNETPVPPRIDPPPPKETPVPPPCVETPVLPEDAPEWMGDPLQELSAVSLGSTYNEVLKALIDLETAYVSSEYEATYVRIETKGRPKEVGDWIQNARSVPVKIKKLAVFEAKWKAWWAKMQPSWRAEDSPLLDDEDDRDWGILAAPGVNGMLSVVGTLYWWGCTEKPESSVVEWQAATEDVLLVLRGLRASLDL